MDNSMFYINFIPDSEEQKKCVEQIQNCVTDSIDPVYLIKKPIIDKKVDYEYKEAFLLLMPKHKMLFIDFGTDEEMFQEFRGDFIDDIGYIAKKYDFLKILGRPRQWENDFVQEIKYSSESFSISDILNENELVSDELIRRGEIIISLATGSINEAERLGAGTPDNILDQIKRKIILFDGEQTKFIFDEPSKKRITIQGLAGTGKTELLLHKIKELYTESEDTRIVFTCYNEILADSLRKRVPEFFDFMKVEEQIQWNKRLWVMRSWGSYSNPNSGVYSYICNRYKIPFSSLSYNNNFDTVCCSALIHLNEIEDFECCFDYILIDESQDFQEGFFKLCEKVSKKCLYVAGDIFQDIFDNKSLTVVNPDFLLNKCYRTDPRTLMGAHAIGMGLFEKKRLRWLEDDEWNACGYEIKRNGGNVELHRKPLRRFEDVDMKESDGITIIPAEQQDYQNVIMNLIDNIRKNYETVEPDDIAVVFMENMDLNYILASRLQIMVKEKFGWDVNIGYETKERKKGTFFVSNKNNVKGLEFPFVICVMQTMPCDSFSARNAIYMMLTRSFLTSFLVVPSETSIISEISGGVDFVNRKGYLCVTEPSEEEKLSIKNTFIKQTNLHMSLYDMVELIMNDMKLTDVAVRNTIHELTRTMFKKEVDRTKLTEFIRTNWSMME